MNAILFDLLLALACHILSCIFVACKQDDDQGNDGLEEEEGCITTSTMMYLFAFIVGYGTYTCYTSAVFLFIGICTQGRASHERVKKNKHKQEEYNKLKRECMRLRLLLLEQQSQEQVAQHPVLPPPYVD